MTPMHNLTPTYTTIDVAAIPPPRPKGWALASYLHPVSNITLAVAETATTGKALSLGPITPADLAILYSRVAQYGRRRGFTVHRRTVAGDSYIWATPGRKAPNAPRKPRKAGKSHKALAPLAPSPNGETPHAEPNA